MHSVCVPAGVEAGISVGYVAVGPRPGAARRRFGVIGAPAPGLCWRLGVRKRSLWVEMFRVFRDLWTRSWGSLAGSWGEGWWLLANACPRCASEWRRLLMLSLSRSFPALAGQRVG